VSDVCKKCGNNLYGNKTKCPFCGEPIKGGYGSSGPNSSNFSSSSYSSNPNSHGSTVRRSASVDDGGAGWGLLGFCLPLIGIILYLVWQDEKPNTAKACLNGALVSILIGFFFGIISSCGAAL
jgi:hypothetical protein